MIVKNHFETAPFLYFPAPSSNRAFFLPVLLRFMQCYHGTMVIASIQLEVLDAEIRSRNTLQTIQ